VGFDQDLINNIMEENKDCPTSVEYELIPLPPEEPLNPSKTGNKPKQLKAIEVFGYEVGRGLRKKVVVPEDIYKLAALGCSDQEIATWFDIEYSTLRYNFSETIAKGRQDLKAALRKAMLQNAMNGNAALQIFLAKNMLGMSDNPGQSEENRPLPWREDADTSTEEDSQ
jgi:hypothetical protein